MCKLKTILGINVAVFGILGVLHLLRLIQRWPVQLAGWNVPLWPSAVFLIVAAVLLYLNYKHLKQ